jgi:hypothetical protein
MLNEFTLTIMLLNCFYSFVPSKYIKAKKFSEMLGSSWNYFTLIIIYMKIHYVLISEQSIIS